MDRGAIQVPIAIVKKRTMLWHGLHELLRILGLTMFEMSSMNQPITPLYEPAMSHPFPAKTSEHD